MLKRAAAVLILLLVGVFLWPPRQLHTIVIGNKTFFVDVANSAEERDKGLGGRNQLSAHEGMLFIFETEAKHCIWMKDMKFSIDVIWLDSSKKVAQVADNISPATYPNKFCSEESASYVLEINAGQAAANNITKGAEAKF